MRKKHVLVFFVLLLITSCYLRAFIQKDNDIKRNLPVCKKPIQDSIVFTNRSTPIDTVIRYLKDGSCRPIGL